MSLTYHAGQIELQTEANTRPIAERLSQWTGPVSDFTLGADLILLAAMRGGELQFASLSGAAPLVAVDDLATVQFPARMLPGLTAEVLAGGIAINLATRRRARLNGRLVANEAGSRLEPDETFCNCRKYIAPTFAVEDA